MYSIAKKVAEVLNLGDQGKVNSFLSRGIKRLESEKKNILVKIKPLEAQFEIDLADAQSKLEDLQEDLMLKYQDIPVNELSTNASQDHYFDIYIKQIETAEKAVAKQEKYIVKIQESYKDLVEGIEAKGAAIQARLDILSQTSEEQA